MYGVSQVEVFDECGGVGGVVVHVVSVGHLGRAAVAAPIVGDDSVALVEEVEELGVPVVGTEGPAVMEDERLGGLWSPVFEGELDTVFGGDGLHERISFGDSWMVSSVTGCAGSRCVGRHRREI